MVHILLHIILLFFQLYFQPLLQVLLLHIYFFQMQLLVLDTSLLMQNSRFLLMHFLSSDLKIFFNYPILHALFSLLYIKIFILYFIPKIHLFPDVIFPTVHFPLPILHPHFSLPIHFPLPILHPHFSFPMIPLHFLFSMVHSDLSLHHFYPILKLSHLRFLFKSRLLLSLLLCLQLSLYIILLLSSVFLWLYFLY